MVSLINENRLLVFKTDFFQTMKVTFRFNFSPIVRAITYQLFLKSMIYLMSIQTPYRYDQIQNSPFIITIHDCKHF
jgi:hypothetical protein